ncbi:MAG: dephospho-CoA kinase [Chloroflexi bacterium]|nr:dephospho-CoA kinase [Chloroflexota bacterium]
MTPRFPHLYLIGLTGNIGCGKSTVVEMLAARGAHVIDADAVTRQVMEVGQPAYQQIVEVFGADILQTANGPIDRPALGRIVFGDTAALKTLESIVHPATREMILSWLRQRAAEAEAAGRRDVAVVDAIKLLEAGYPAFCDAVWVVACDEAEQIRRLVGLRGMSEADARQRIAAQPPQSAKIAAADVVIDNSGALDATERQVAAAWQQISRQ